MGSALTSFEKSSRKRSSTTSTSTQDQYEVRNKYYTMLKEQSDLIGSDDKGKTQWSFEQRTATLRDTKRATEDFLTACASLKESVSTKVDGLLSDLPDAHDPHFETKYKTIVQQLRELVSKKRNTPKRSTKKKK